MKKILILITTLVVFCAFTACTSGNNSDNTNSSENISQSATEENTFEPIPLGDFSVQDFDGNILTKDIFKDYDLTMVNLWTTTCSYCIEEMLPLNTIRDEFQSEGKKINIIGICMDIGNTDDINDDNFKIAQEIIKKTGVLYLNIIPDDVLLLGRLKGIQAFPESFFVDNEGNVITDAHVGALGKNQWKVLINEEFDKIEKSLDKE
ncbi:hypothetical protein SH1V18_08420 [Vallitalea longa]|uniref:Thioredoxin domain-containing protein n=1 Tax=Vallitalea longa TaxID=2936439 RepID=A0A9W5Y7Y0_9FIRM|nr:TlpA disulfide reductase family protein [Vallitalea longa]GKX28362.1 hypothetical protein SH1V18_08420 [Vallitalea longa]